MYYYHYFSNIFLYMCIIILVVGLVNLVLRFSINWDKGKYSDYRKFMLLTVGIAYTIYSFINFYMYFIGKLMIGVVIVSFEDIILFGFILIKLKYSKYDRYIE